MNEELERFRNDAFASYFDVLNRYRTSIRKATSKLDKENEYVNSHNALMQCLLQKKRVVMLQYSNKTMENRLSEALDTECFSFLQKFDKEAELKH